MSTVAALPVRMCICYSRTFADVRSECERLGLTTVAEIAEATGCGSGCGRCRPYLERMLQTGSTAFPILPPSPVRAG